ncbi:MAG: hypothetical protein ACOC5T_02660 [Elusimicrobiota bacterium]
MQNGKKTRWLYQDQYIVICKCSSHPNKWICVLRRHTSTPTRDELQYMKTKLKRLLPKIKKWREPHSIPEHYHLHET